MKFVKDASVWQEMDGDTELEKRLNSYLTTLFIYKKDMPADECLDEARKIIGMVKAGVVRELFGGG